MKIILKKIISILFILLGLAPLLFVLFITFKKEQVRFSMKHELKQQLLQTVVVPESEVIWMDKLEIWVNNSMFDIQSKKLETGVYTFTGLYDEKETILMALERNTTGKNKEQNKLLLQLLKLLPVFCIEVKEFNPLVTYNRGFCFYLPQSLLNPILEINTPPPQDIC